MASLDIDRFRGNLLKYTRKAFQMLPPMENPSILDVGCGTGTPTLELARLSGGQVTGIDVDEKALARFREKIKAAGLGDRVRAVRCSLFELDFPDESFDVIWCEGAIHPIGFSKALRTWARLLRPSGHFVFHDARTGLEKKLDNIGKQGYTLIGHFTLSSQIWMQEYFRPLMEHIESIPPQDIDGEMQRDIDRVRQEFRMFENDPLGNSSVYFVIRR